MKAILVTAGATAVITALSMTVAGQTTFKPATAVAWVSASRVMNESNRGRSEGGRLQRLQQQRATEIRTKQQALETLRQQLAQANDAAARGPLLQQEQQQRVELERFTAQAQVDLQNMQREINLDLQNRIRPILQELMKTNGLTIVFNQDTSIMGATPDADLTAAVIAQLNALPQ